MSDIVLMIGCVAMFAAMIFGLFIVFAGLIGAWRMHQIIRQHDVEGFKSWDMPGDV